ncbi:enoyl-CoA hydratase-related protein [Polycladidibacter stylochi]|uniref:enoyl-CoA hydratase-related protein n=1 Tax=Polycladidibacter stylochi TaxID=1807766 RepID=UPI00082E567C|nr:enoyl-CoA hydratase-related protein [Pseudovibrio stylochi]
MFYETLRIENLESGITTISLDRPEKRNAINSQMMDEFVSILNILEKDTETRVVILAAIGRTFCAGGDLKWMQDQARKPRQAKIDEATRLAKMLERIDNFTKPIIAKVNGPAYGGGVGLLSVCDIVVAADDCQFALTETRLGLIPATIGPYVVRRLGEGAARQVFMNAKSFSAHEAQRLGLVSQVVNSRQLGDATLEEADAFLRCAPGAVSEAKQLCLYLSRSSQKEQVAHSVEKLADRWESDEAQKAIASFFAQMGAKEQMKNAKAAD